MSERRQATTARELFDRGGRRAKLDPRALASRLRAPAAYGSERAGPVTTEPEEPLTRVAFSRETLPGLRRLVAASAERARLARARGQDLVLAIDELATNSVMYGGGGGELRLWSTEEGLLCEVRDGGHISDPLVGLRPPQPEQHDGRGLWVVSQLCDHMEISSSPGRTVVRVRVRR